MKIQKIIADAWRARVKNEPGIRIRVLDPKIPGSEAMGGVRYNPDTQRIDEALLPGSTDAIGRTIRIHEADHVRYSPRDNREALLVWGDRIARMPLVEHWQRLEDIRISCPKVWANRSANVLAEMMITAAHDLKIAVQMLLNPAESGTPEQFNQHLLFYMRGMALHLTAHALLSRVEGGPWASTDPRIWSALSEGMAQATAELEKCDRSLQIILGQAGQVVGLIHSADTISLRGASGMRESESRIDGRRKLGKALDELEQILQKPPVAPWEFKEREPFSIPAPRPDGSTSDPFRYCQIERLPLSIDTLAHNRNILRVPSFSGPRLRAGSLVQLALGIPGSHFIKRAIKESPNGASVMIDASGSMSISTEQLETLGQQIPAGFIAYYCAGGEYSQGRITIYAEHGRRAEKMPKRIGNGNFVDYAALLTLMGRKERPRILVTDLGFCGGPGSDIVAAHTLVTQATRAGELIVMPTIQSAIAYLKDGTMPDPEDNDND